jgi:hypothetical protein
MGIKKFQVKFNFNFTFPNRVKTSDKSKLKMFPQFAVVLIFVVAAMAGSEKVDPQLRKSLETKQHFNIIITMTDQPDLSSIGERHFAQRGARMQAIRDTLLTFSDNSQKSLLNAIHSRRPSFAATFRTQSFWITNQVYVQKADNSLIQELMNRD